MYELPHIELNEVIMYLRKSRADDAMLTVEEVLSKHEQMLDDWSMRVLGGLIPQENRFREVVSGETIEDRPQIQTVLRMIESPKYKAVLVVEPQRISRGWLDEVGKISNIFRYTNTLVFTPTYSFDISNEMDRESFVRELQRGNDYLEYTKKILRRGKELKVRNGEYIGSVPPFGYDKYSYKDGKRTVHTLKENEIEAPIVRYIFEQFANAKTAAKIADELNEMGATPRTAAVWTAPLISQMITNPHYIGKIRWMYKPSCRHIEDGEVVSKRKDIQQTAIYDGLHEGIVDDETFSRCQQIAGTHPKIKKAREIVNPLAGLFFCECGKPMRMTPQANKYDVRRYSCSSITYKRQCGNSSAKCSDVMDAVINAIKSELNDLEIRLTTDTKKSSNAEIALKESISVRLQDAEAKEMRAWDEFLSGKMPRKVLDGMLSQISAEKTRLQKALDKAVVTDDNKEHIENCAITLHNALDSLSDKNISAADKNALLKACVERIVYYKHSKQEPFHLEIFLR